MTWLKNVAMDVLVMGTIGAILGAIAMALAVYLAYLLAMPGGPPP